MKNKNKSIIEKMLDKMIGLDLIRSKYLKDGSIVYFVTELGKISDIYPENYFPENPIFNSPTTLVNALNITNKRCMCEKCSDEINIGF
jgi:hypothetical protein